MDGRRDVPTDGHFRPPQMLLGRLGVDLKILHNSNILCMQITLHHCSQRVSLDKHQQQTNVKLISLGACSSMQYWMIQLLIHLHNCYSTSEVTLLHLYTDLVSIILQQ